MGYLKDQKIIYVDTIIDKLDNNTSDNLKYCPKDSMNSNVKTLTLDGPDGEVKYENRYFELDEIKETLGTSNGSELPDCPTDGRDFSGCCKKLAIENSGNMLDDCDNGHSTGLVYKIYNKHYNICHSEEIQSKKNFFGYITDKKGGLEKFFMLLLVTIIVIVFYTFISLPYEFWLRYGNSIDCIYYKVKSTCANMGSKKSDTNRKLTIIEYIFPDNLHNVPYEKCKNIPNDNMKGGREKDGIINSNYIEYNENGSKCINVDFGDDIDNKHSREFPYNLGEYANTKKVKNVFIAMILKGFSFYFLYTILFIRYVLNKSLSFFSKLYQKKFENYPAISSVLLILNFLITPFLIIGIIISVIFGILSVFPMYITIADLIKSLNIFKEDIESSPSSTEFNSNYYTIYDFNNVFYNLSSDNFNADSDGFHKNNKFFALVLGVIIAAVIGSLFNNAIITIISLFVFLIGFYAASKSNMSMPERAVFILDLLKKIILNIALSIPLFFTLITTFSFGMLGSILAGLHITCTTFAYFYYIPFSNSIELLDLLKNHSKLLTILLLISVITSSNVGGLGSQVTGILGGLLGLYLLYELYKLSK